MKLHLIYKEKTNTHTLELFHEAAQELNVEIVEILSNHFDFSDFHTISGGDAVYCLSDDAISQLVEKSILQKDTKTFYKNYETAIAKTDDADDITSYLIHKTAGLPIIDSIPVITNQRDLLEKYVHKLGGFPIVIKALGGSKGHGTMRIDSMESLNSIDDYLVGTQDRFIVKKYIEEAKSVRAVVVGGHVVAAIEHKALEGDFRSNSGRGDHQPRSYAISSTQEAIAVAAVETLNFEFGGVDLSINHDGEVFITEVNMPCSFLATQRETQAPIASLMIKHLLNKSAFDPQHPSIRIR